MDKDTVLKIEGLSKKYIISHQTGRKGGASHYIALRDVIAEKAKNIAQNLFKPQKWFKRSEKEEFWALKDINMEIKRGDKVAIIGHNGAGKSTLLKILSRITEPTEGKIKIRGRVTSLLEVGTGFHPELTGRENIYLNGSILGMTHAEIDQKFDEIVAFAGVEKFLDTPVKRYSSGMRMRLGFAVAAHLESEILIIDEVLAVGDAEFQKKCIGKMDEISKTNERTILFVSHNMGAVQQLCDKGIVLQSGKVISNGNISASINVYNQIKSIEGDKLNLIKRHPDILLKNILIQVDGSDISIKMIFDSKGNHKNAYLGFTIYNSKYGHIAQYHGRKSSRFFDLNKGENSISVEINDFAWGTGSYRLRIDLMSLAEGVLFCANNISVANEEQQKEIYVHENSIFNFTCTIESESQV